jgi:hypothetical protein
MCEKTVFLTPKQYSNLITTLLGGISENGNNDKTFKQTLKG